MIRPQFIAVAGAVVITAAIGLNYALWQEEAGPAAGHEPKSAALGDKAGSTAKPSPGAYSLPAFDVVRVNPLGDTVIAGRAQPASTVRIMDDGAVIGEVVADARGEWVFLPEKPLPPGSRRLSLEMTTKEGVVVASRESVIMVVPQKDKDIAGQPTGQESQPLALKIRPDGSVIVMQKPAKEDALPISVDAVDYDDTGKLSISGRAEAGARVQVYLDNRFIGRAESGGNGVWSLSPEAWVEPGLYKLRADLVDVGGKVITRVEFPFKRAEPLSEMKPGTFVVVQPGNSLWRLARRTYGSGFRYTVIFKANLDQIKDADLIYPGQVFALPATN
ncbi:MAG: LysM peptidoglycan-binding domain-containing protein [Rhodospirillales bacterium]